jgi:hypothetical protein
MPQIQRITLSAGSNQKTGGEILTKMLFGFSECGGTSRRQKGWSMDKLLEESVSLLAVAENTRNSILSR